MSGMKVKFLKDVTVEFLDHRHHKVSELYPDEKTFHCNEVVDVDYTQENINGFIDLFFENGDVAVGVSKMGLTLL